MQKIKFFLFFLLLNSLLSIGIFFATPDHIFGNDFFDFHNASQATFIEGISPYSEEVTLRNQWGVYGKPAEAGQDQLAFNYPPYALLPFLPLAFLPLKWAQSVWISFLFSLLLTLPLLAYPRIPRWALMSSFAFYPITFSLILGNYAILLGTILIFVIGYLLDKEYASTGLDIFAGALLAFTTIKPQFSALYLLFILLLALQGKRWRFIQSFFISFLVMVAFSFILLPRWPLEWYQQLFKYVESNQAIPHISIFFQFFLNASSAHLLSMVVTGLLVIVLGWLLWKSWLGKVSAQKTLVFIGFLTYAVHPRTVSYEQIVFLLPFLIWIFSNPPAIPSHTKVAFWFSGILISWAGFFAARAGWSALFPLEWIFGFYLIWMIYIFLTPSGLPSNAVHLQNHDSTAP
jgi:hypothetical protein